MDSDENGTIPCICCFRKEQEYYNKRASRKDDHDPTWPSPPEILSSKPANQPSEGEPAELENSEDGYTCGSFMEEEDVGYDLGPNASGAA